MKTIKLILFTMLLLFVPTILFAQSTEQEPFDITQLIVGLTPVIVWAATWLSKKLLPQVPGIVILILVPLLSGALVWITNLAGQTDLTWWMQLIYGLGAVFIDQLSKQVKK